MKKNLCILMAAIIISAVGCSAGSENDLENGDVEHTSGTTDIPNTEIGGTSDSENSDTSTETDVQESAKAEPYTETFMDGENSVTVIYPRYGDGKHELFDISLREYAMQMYRNSGMMPEDSALYEITSLTITYESEKLVSAVAEGHIINTTAAHDNNFSYTVNADPQTGRVYLKEELVGDVDVIKFAFSDGKFSQTYGISGLMNEITADDITRSWRSDYGVYPDIYFTNGSFGVVAELAHALGGYAGFEIPISESDSMINNTAKGLLGK